MNIPGRRRRRGYFHWELPQPQLTALLKHTDKLNDREKICLIHNLNGLESAGVLSTGDDLSPPGRLLHNRQPMVAALAINMLATRRHVFVNDSNREAWKKYSRRA